MKLTSGKIKPSIYIEARTEELILLICIDHVLTGRQILQDNSNNNETPLHSTHYL